MGQNQWDPFSWDWDVHWGVCQLVEKALPSLQLHFWVIEGVPRLHVLGPRANRWTPLFPAPFWFFPQVVKHPCPPLAILRLGGLLFASKPPIQRWVCLLLRYPFLGLFKETEGKSNGNHVSCSIISGQPHFAHLFFLAASRVLSPAVRLTEGTPKPTHTPNAPGGNLPSFDHSVPFGFWRCPSVRLNRDPHKTRVALPRRNRVRRPVERGVSGLHVHQLPEVGLRLLHDAHGQRHGAALGGLLGPGLRARRAAA